MTNLIYGYKRGNTHNEVETGCVILQVGHIKIGGLPMDHILQWGTAAFYSRNLDAE